MMILHQMQMSGTCYKVRLTARHVGKPIALRDYPLHGVPMLKLDDSRYLPRVGCDPVVLDHRHKSSAP
jgi:hypothetical protein